MLFEKDTADAYRVFDTMEHFLRQPEHLRGQLQVQLGDATQVSVGVLLLSPILLLLMSCYDEITVLGCVLFDRLGGDTCKASFGLKKPHRCLNLLPWRTPRTRR